VCVGSCSNFLWSSDSFFSGVAGFVGSGVVEVVGVDVDVVGIDVVSDAVVGVVSGVVDVDVDVDIGVGIGVDVVPGVDVVGGADAGGTCVDGCGSL